MNKRLPLLSLVGLLCFSFQLTIFAQQNSPGKENAMPPGLKGAVAAVRKAADQGDPMGQFRLGLLYKAGVGVTKDNAEAAKWFRKSADQGNANAQLDLGAMYAKGEGVGKDPAEAVKWYTKAALQGDQFAQHYLGAMYVDGDGVHQDYVEAYAWLNLAAAAQQSVQANEIPENAENRKRNQQACATERGTLAKKMSSEQVSEAKKRSSQLNDRILGRKGVSQQ